MTEAMTNPTDAPSTDRELIERLRQLARRQRQHGAENAEQIDLTCAMTIGNLDATADRLESLLSDRAKLEEMLASAFVCDDCGHRICELD